MGLFGRKKAEAVAESATGAAGAAATPAAGEKKKKLTKKEKEALERELRRNLPKRTATGRNGVFEMSGPLSFTWAAGNVPGGPFVPVNVVCHGHNVYLFEGGEAGNAPSAKPKLFLQVKRAEVENIGLLLIPPLPPHSNVFKLTFAKKQFGHRAFFFKGTSKKDVDRWLTDLRWRVQASEQEIKRKNEPPQDKQVRISSLDETESAVMKAPQRILGLSVRYEERPKVESQIDDL